jgi:Ca2+/Na+ antiporter
MAIANALGSNVQNVFLALALPWVFKTMFAPGQYIAMATPGIMDGVAWCFGTLMVVFGCAAWKGFTFEKWMGGFFFFLYALYLVDACFIHG